MKKILGLDLGSASIGWAVVTEHEGRMTIERLGSRIIPLSSDDVKEFTKGNAISKNASRTQRRTQRKGYDRYQQRRENLTRFLRKYDMLPDEALIKLDKLSLWGLRARAVYSRLSLAEIGRVLYHINQKRGYKATKSDYDAGADKKQGEYVKSVMGRHREIAERGITIGQLFAEKLSADPAYRTKEQVFPRRAYVEEFDRIVACQRAFYPHVFTDENIDTLRNRIIFFQRKLKSCKHLVAICDFEKREYRNSSGRIVIDGPKVAPRSSPLAQACKIRESVNNITLINRVGLELEITAAQRREMFDHLDGHEKLTLKDLYRILKIDKSDGWWGGKTFDKGLQGNTTRNAIRKALGGKYEELLRFDLKCRVDPQIGDIVPVISEDFLNEPLYRLWHVLYSIEDRAELSRALEKQFGITDPAIVDNLYALDFVKQGYANKSAKAMRRILPYLEQGMMYSEACKAAGFNHSGSLNKAENSSRKLLDRLQPIPKNELRQPIVEKILNQMIDVVNALMEKNKGPFDEIRVELARSLKQSKDERNKTTKAIDETEKKNEKIGKRLQAEYGLTPTRSRIQKYKMWEEAGKICFYCGRPVNVAEFLEGFDVEVEHIIPRSLFFDDSFSNKVCACRVCNKEKNNRTAYDYMKSKSDGEFQDYLERIEKLHKQNKISKIKYQRLLTPGDKIPTDFIDRQLRESQYIARKARAILSSVCRDVTSTSGSVTDFIRRVWGWNKVLHNLNLDRYKQAGLTEIRERRHKDNLWSEEVIKDWNKRLDHRHHAIDALVIACTKQDYIKKMNDMSELKDVSFAPGERQGEPYQGRLTLLERYIGSERPFQTAEVAAAADSVLVSFKAGKKGATRGKRYIHRGGRRLLVQQGILIPRGPLHEEHVYGMIDRYAKNRKGETVVQKKCVLKYPLTSIGRKDVDFIVDDGIRELVRRRFESRPGNEKEVWRDLENDPLTFHGAPVRSVRCFTGLKQEKMVALDRGFVELGNNHHIAIYKDRDGNRHESCVALWEAVKRKKERIPVVITDPAEVWDHLPEGLPDEFMARLPRPDWSYEVSLRQNEMFVLGLEPEAFEEAVRDGNRALLGRHLYRVQQISSGDYLFRLHVETMNDRTREGKEAGKFHRIKSFGKFFDLNPRKVQITLLGEIK